MTRTYKSVLLIACTLGLILQISCNPVTESLKEPTDTDQDTLKTTAPTNGSTTSVSPIAPAKPSAPFNLPTYISPPKPATIRPVVPPRTSGGTSGTPGRSDTTITANIARCLGFCPSGRLPCNCELALIHFIYDQEMEIR